MNFISTLAVAMGSSWASGLNLYAGVATLGLLSRFGHLKLPGELQALSSWWVIGVAAGLYLVEFVADKIPIVDSTWDVIHTFIRIPAGAIIAAAAFGDFDKSLQVIAFLVGGGLALSSHGTKATTRALLNTSPEPFSNIAASLIEDVIAIGSTLASVLLPILALVIVGIGVLISALVLPKIFRFLRRVFQSIKRPFSSGAATTNLIC